VSANLHGVVDDIPHMVQRQGPCVSVESSGKCREGTERESKRSTAGRGLPLSTGGTCPYLVFELRLFFCVKSGRVGRSNEGYTASRPVHASSRELLDLGGGDSGGG
jgi:hypothetical protein